MSDRLMDNLERCEPTGVLGMQERIAELEAERDKAIAKGHPKAPFRFVRYRNGVEMAEGVTIEKASTLSEAAAKAAAIAASRYPVSDVLVFSGALDAIERGEDV